MENNFCSINPRDNMERGFEVLEISGKSKKMDFKLKDPFYEYNINVIQDLIKKKRHLIIKVIYR